MSFFSHKKGESGNFSDHEELFKNVIRESELCTYEGKIAEVRTCEDDGVYFEYDYLPASSVTRRASFNSGYQIEPNSFVAKSIVSYKFAVSDTERLAAFDDHDILYAKTDRLLYVMCGECENAATYQYENDKQLRAILWYFAGKELTK